MIYKKHCEIAKTAIIGNNVTIGYPGFKVEQDKNGNNYVTEHKFKVIIGEYCNIRNQVCIDRGRWRNTVIEDYVMMDNFCHIGHNAIIGRNSILCTGVIIGGGTEIGEKSYLSLGVITKDNIKIGKNAFIKMGAIVTDDVPDGGKVGGFYDQRFFQRYFPELDIKKDREE